jgi:hypothetical protein
MLTYAVAIGAAGCSHHQPAVGARPGAAADSAARREAVGPVPVEIDNRGTSEVVVYVVRGSIRQRLAEASPVSRTTAVVPASFTDDRGGVVLFARPIAGSTTFTTERVYPQAGDRLVLILQPLLVESTLVVR